MSLIYCRNDGKHWDTSIVLAEVSTEFKKNYRKTVTVKQYSIFPSIQLSELLKMYQKNTLRKVLGLIPKKHPENIQKTSRKHPEKQNASATNN